MRKEKEKMQEKSETSLDPDRKLSRRNFFKLSGMAAAGAALGLSLTSAAEAHKWPKKNPTSKSANYWKWVQHQFTLDPKIVYMNIGTTGSMPEQVLKKYHDYNMLNARHPKTFESELDATFGLTQQRETLALQFGCNADEICLTRNTTDGLDAIVYGLDFQPGDEILITHHEHIAALSPLNVIKDRYGVVLTEVEIPVLGVTEKSQFVEAFEKKIGRKTKAILFSHITYKTGTRLPARELCRLAGENGLTSIVDGAHGPGMIELDFHDMGCDFYAAPGHKWQCGPGGTGILYLRNGGKDLPPFWTQNSSLYTFLAQYHDRGEYDIAYSLQYHGQLNIPAHLAMMDACAMWEEIGRDRIEEYVCGLSAYLKKRLRDKFGSTGTFFSPDLPEFTTGLTAFNPFDDITDGDLIETMVNRLQEETGYQIRYTNFHLYAGDTSSTYSLRISTHLFHNRQQIDGLVDAIFDVYMRMVRER
jgi:selenocysteine lyase/cysteine desulfurase